MAEKSDKEFWHNMANEEKKIYSDIDKNGFCILQGDSIEIIPLLEDNSIKLMYGSPPYPNAKRNYRTWKIDNYIEEISPAISNIIPKLKDNGFIVINVKANRVNPTSTTSSERSLVVEELMIYMKNQLKLYCVDIEIWIKTNPVPTGIRVACQDSYEYNLWFSKSPKWTINIDAIRREYSEATLKTYQNTIYKPRKNGLLYVSKEKKIIANEIGALPLNIVSGSVSNKTVDHQAVQPEYLSEKYIKACTNENDIVFDPWVGSGTTGIVSLKNKRKFIGFDISKPFADLALSNLNLFLESLKTGETI
jgi:site-specific DNA-methyltransferase (adenine-specific)